MSDPRFSSGFKKLPHWLVAIALVIGCWFSVTLPAQAVNNPELLPAETTPVVDLANFIPDQQEEGLIEEINQFEADTGWKLRVLTQYDRSPGRAVIPFWGLDDVSILLVADARGGNLLALVLAMRCMN